MFRSLLIISFVLVKSFAEDSTNGCPDVQVIQDFKAYRYLGRWYEQAKYPNEFEKEGKCVGAEYSLASNGSIQVLNFMENNRTKKATSIKGSARLESEASGEGKLLVYFKVAVAEAPYWILDTDYTNYSVVWTCWNPLNIGVKKSAWILTRSRNPSEEILNKAMDVLKNQKISTDLLVKTDQTECA